MHRRRQHLSQAAARRLKATLFHDGSEVEAITCSCERHVEKTFRLLAIALRLVFVCPRLEVTHRNRHIVSGLASDAD